MIPVAGPVLLGVATVALVAAAARPRSRVPWLAAGAGSLAAATGLLAWALVTDDYSLRYVADTARRGTSPTYRLAGLWGGMAGSLLLWATATACWAVVAQRVERATARVGALATLAPVVALVTVSRPFDRLDLPPLDGEGLAPILEHWAMLVHPPLLYVGLTGLVVPAALAFAGRHAAVRRWTLTALVPLTAGIALGARWAYVELGWGGFWAWDPVENGALLPWLAALGVLHERRAPARAARLAIAAFFLAGVGTWLTRSGATVSVHAFAEARAVGWILLAALLLGFLGAISAIYGRNRAQKPVGRLGWSAATVLALVALVAVAVGTLVPAAMGTLLDRPRTIDPAFFTRFAAPPLVALAVLAAVVAVRRAPAVLAHAGAALVLAGAVGTALGADEQVVLETGEAASVGGHTVSLDGVEAAGRRITAAIVVDGSPTTVELRTSANRRVVTAETALSASPFEDVLVAPRILEADPGRAVLDVHVEPLASLVWVGGALAIAGLAGRAYAVTRSRRRRQTGLVGGPENFRPVLPAVLPGVADLARRAEVVEGDAREALVAAASGEPAPPGELVVWAWTFDPDHEHVVMVDHRIRRKLLPPGGRVEPGEDPVAAAARELEEETGLRIDPTNAYPALLDVVRATDDGIDYQTFGMAFVFVADRSAELAGEPDQDAVWVPVRERPDRVSPHHWDRLQRYLAQLPPRLR